MPLRALLRMLESNEQVIQQLSEFPPIRQAAKTTAFFMTKGKDIVEDKVDETIDKVGEHLKDNQENPNASRFTETFSQELKDGLEELKQEMKKKK